MRCPQCNKFTGLENAEPEIDDLTVSDIEKDSMEVTIGGHHVRQCAECSTDLKSIDFGESETVDLAFFEGWGNLTAEEQEQVRAAAEAGNLTADLDAGQAEVEESGGMRYRKNIITITVEYDITIDLRDVLKPKNKDDRPLEALTYSHAFTFSNAASSYDECC